MTQPSDTF